MEPRDTMTQFEAEALSLAKRIQVLPAAERVKILARVMEAEGREVPWEEIQRIQKGAEAGALDEDTLERDIVEAVRQVRQERRRKGRS
jgi:hypothetical protein